VISQCGLAETIYAAAGGERKQRRREMRGKRRVDIQESEWEADLITMAQRVPLPKGEDAKT